MTKQKNRSSEQQLRSVTQAAEAVALGTMAGGLALGAVQAREAQPLAEDAQGEAKAAVVDPTTDVKVQLKSVEDKTPAEQGGTVEEQDRPTGDVSTAEEAPGSLPLHEDHAVPETEVIPVRETNTVALAEVDAPVTQQISGVIERLVTDAGDVGSTEAPALPLAGRILESVADIVSTLKPGIDTSALKSIGDTIQAQVDTALEPSQQMLADLPDTIRDTVSEALTGSSLDALSAELASLPSSVSALTGSVENIVGAMDLASLPSSLLGHDGPAVDEGLLSSVFYSDGEAETLVPAGGLGQSAESLFIPDMMQSATSNGSVADGGIGLLGLSYADLSPDGMHPASGGVGGLGLL